MTPKEEAAFAQGERAALLRILGAVSLALAQGGVANAKTRAAALLLEREAAIVALRSVCGKHGSNTWPDNLHLADIITKHLERQLDEEERDDAEHGQEREG